MGQFKVINNLLILCFYVRYASLAFKKNIDAKMAVKEMNGKEINGKSVKVRLVKTPGEYTSSLCHKNGMERGTSKESSSASLISRWPRTRPRQLGSEPDREVSFPDGPLTWSLYMLSCNEELAEQVTPEAGVLTWE